MALILCDGLDSTAANTDIIDRWDFGPDTAAGYSATLGRNGGPCTNVGSNITPLVKHLPAPLCQPGGGAALFTTVSSRFLTFPTTTATRVLMGWTNERTPGTNTDANARTIAQTTLTVTVTSAGVLQLRRNDAIVATGTTVLSVNTWYRIEAKVANLDDTGGVFELRINGVADAGLNLTNADLWQAGSKELNAVFFSTFAARNDDFIIMDSTGTSFNNFLGDLLIETVRPSAPGATTQSTPNTGTAWQAVDEVALDADTTYTAITTVNNFDTYAYGNMVTTPTTIHGVVVTTQAASPGMTPRKIKAVAKVSETSILGAEKSVLLDLSAGYRAEQEAFATRPAGGAWTKADVDAAEFGWQVTQ